MQKKTMLLCGAVLPLTLAGCLRDQGAPVDYRGNIIYGREANYDEHGNELPKYSKENPAVQDAQIADKYVAKEVEYSIAAEVPEVKAADADAKGLTHLESGVASFTNAPRDVILADAAEAVAVAAAPTESAVEAAPTTGVGGFFSRLKQQAKSLIKKDDVAVEQTPQVVVQAAPAEVVPPVVAVAAPAPSVPVAAESVAREAEVAHVEKSEKAEEELAVQSAKNEENKAKLLAEAMAQQKQAALKAKKEENAQQVAQDKASAPIVAEMSETEKVVKAAALAAAEPMKSVKTRVKPAPVADVVAALPVAPVQVATPKAVVPAVVAALPAPKPVEVEEDVPAVAAPAQVASLAPVAPVVAAPAPVEKVVQPPVVAASAQSFNWPVKGKVLSKFGNVSAAGRANEGVNIAAAEGSPVAAAADGVVVYADSRLKNYGNMIIVQHANGWLSAYAHTGQIAVKKGERVSAGQSIATVGATGNVDQPQLHFALRKNKQPVDPQKILGKGA